MGKNDIDKNANNGLQTKLWGPPLWTGLHAITFGYPLEPTEQDKKNYKIFFDQVKYVLPCKYCRESYTEYINTEPTKLTDEVLTNRSTLTKWLFNLHNRVNNKLDVDYGTTWDEIVEKFESFRAKCDPQKKTCSMPLNLKAESYKLSLMKDCPIISYKLAKKFESYAKLRNVNDFNLLKECFEFSKVKKCQEWIKRNEDCCDIIKYMKLNSIPSLETEGKYIGLPTVEELKLISRLCTNLSRTELEQISEKLDKINKQTGGKYKVYKFKINIL